MRQSNALSPWPLPIGFVVAALLTEAVDHAGVLPLIAGGFAILPGHIGMMVLPLAVLGLLSHPTRYTLVLVGVCGGLASTDFISVITMASEGPNVMRSVTDARVSAAVGFASALLASLLAYFFQTRQRPKPSRRAVWACLAVLLLTVVAYRVHYAVMVHSGVPNEERSLMVYGYEFHHIYSGTLILWMVMGVIMVRPKWVASVIGMMIMGFAIASTADQVTYFCQSEVSDEAYGNPTSLIGAFAAAAVYGLAMLWLRRGPRGSENFAQTSN